VVTSLHPYYSNKDVIFEPGLVGSWTNTEQSEEHWAFQKEGQNSYYLTYVSAAKQTSPGHACSSKRPNVPGFHHLGAGMRRHAAADSFALPIEVYQLSPSGAPGFVEQRLAKSIAGKESKTHRHEMIADKPDDWRVVLTADTAELRNFSRSI